MIGTCNISYIEVVIDQIPLRMIVWYDVTLDKNILEVKIIFVRTALRILIVNIMIKFKLRYSWSY